MDTITLHNGRFLVLKVYRPIQAERDLSTLVSYFYHVSRWELHVQQL